MSFLQDVKYAYVLKSKQVSIMSSNKLDKHLYIVYTYIRVLHIVPKYMYQ